MNSPLKFLIVLAFASVVSGCATDRTFGTSPDIEITALEELPPPRGEAFHTIGAQESLEITIVGVEELSGLYLTDREGRVTFPFAGQLDFGGKSPSEASRLLADSLRGQYLRDPQVRVIPAEFPPPAISVGGQVDKPGEYAIFGEQTLLRLVNRAGGLEEFAQLDDVLIIRQVDGQRYIGVYNLGAIQRGNYADPRLYPNDIVMVGDSPARRRLASFLQFVPLISTAAIVIERASSGR